LLSPPGTTYLDAPKVPKKYENGVLTKRYRYYNCMKVFLETLGEELVENKKSTEYTQKEYDEIFNKSVEKCYEENYGDIDVSFF